MKEIQAVLFDLDGTLIDSEYFYYTNWAPILKRNFNYDITFDDWIRDFAGHTLAHNVARLVNELHFDTTEELMWRETRAAYAKADMTTIALMPGARDILQFFKDQHVTLALVTSSYQSTVDTVLGHHGLKSYFDLFVTRESVTHPKPDPEPYNLAVERLAIAKTDCLAIEDTVTGATAAKTAGLVCFGVTKQPIERAKLTIVDRLFNNLAEVQQIF